MKHYVTYTMRHSGEVIYVGFGKLGRPTQSLNNSHVDYIRANRPTIILSQSKPLHYGHAALLERYLIVKHEPRLNTNSTSPFGYEYYASHRLFDETDPIFRERILSSFDQPTLYREGYDESFAEYEDWVREKAMCYMTMTSYTAREQRLLGRLDRSLRAGSHKH